MAKDLYDDPKKPNIKALSAFLIKGKPVAKGAVVSKSAFPKVSDWQNLCNMEPARCEETDEKVGTPKAAATGTATKTATKATKTTGMK